MYRTSDYLTTCCVPQCTSKSRKNPDLCYHSFPSVKTEFGDLRRRQWVSALGIDYNVTRRMTVCSKHFKSSDYIVPCDPTKKPYLKRTAVPSLFLSRTTTNADFKRSCETTPIDDQERKKFTSLSGATIICLKADPSQKPSNEAVKEQTTSTSVSSENILISSISTVSSNEYDTYFDENSETSSEEDKLLLNNCKDNLPTKNAANSYSKGHCVVTLNSSKCNLSPANNDNGLKDGRLLESFSVSLGDSSVNQDNDNGHGNVKHTIASPKLPMHTSKDILKPYSGNEHNKTELSSVSFEMPIDSSEDTSPINLQICRRDAELIAISSGLPSESSKALASNTNCKHGLPCSENNSSEDKETAERNENISSIEREKAVTSRNVKRLLDNINSSTTFVNEIMNDPTAGRLPGASMSDSEFLKVYGVSKDDFVNFLFM